MCNSFGQTSSSSVPSFLRTIIAVNSGYYVIMNINHLYSELHDLDANNAIGYTADATFSIVYIGFEGMVIICGGDVQLPLRSCVLTTIDYLVQGFLKTQVSANKP